MSNTPFVPSNFAADVLALAVLRHDAEEAQWQAGKTPVPREDTTERSRGMTSDPTPSITADGRRLKLRAAVIEAEQALEQAAATVRKAGVELTKAMTAWQG